MQEQFTLEQFIDKSISEIVTDVTLHQGISKESKRPYYYIDIHFETGYSLRTFLNSDSQWIISQILNK